MISSLFFNIQFYLNHLLDGGAGGVSHRQKIFHYLLYDSALNADGHHLNQILVRFEYQSKLLLQHEERALIQCYLQVEYE